MLHYLQKTDARCRQYSTFAFGKGKSAVLSALCISFLQTVQHFCYPRPQKNNTVQHFCNSEQKKCCNLQGILKSCADSTALLPLQVAKVLYCLQKIRAIIKRIKRIERIKKNKKSRSQKSPEPDLGDRRPGIWGSLTSLRSKRPGSRVPGPESRVSSPGLGTRDSEPGARDSGFPSPGLEPRVGWV